MMRAVFISTLLILLLLPAVYAEESQKLDKIVVTPSRIQNASTGSGRSVTVLDARTIQLSAYDAVQDMIGNLGGVDIRRRGSEGVQSDVAIRGTTFEQNTVLLDGIKLNDPQTGHYTMDLPLTTFDTDKVEILKGPASSLYGANSFGGVINILTKPPDGKKLIIKTIGGQRDYFSGGASLSHPLGPLKNRFSIEWNRARPYIPNTEFDILNLSESALIDTGFGEYDFFFGYSRKDFGADSFYSSSPREVELTDTRFFKLGGVIERGNLKIEPKIFLRRHYDKFENDKDHVGVGTNYNTNYTYGADLGIIIENQFMDVAYGFELAEDRMFSTNLMKHDRGRTGLYLELSPHINDKLYINAGIRQDTFSDFNTEYSPSVNMKYSLFDFLDVRSSIGRTYRIPTFTDLYYQGPGSIGNPGLNTESSWTYEAGIDYKSEFVKGSIVYFNRESGDTIDWIKTANSDLNWLATNIGSVQTNGAEASIELLPQNLKKDFPISKFFASYTALDEYAKHDYLSKYALDYLKQQIAAGLEYNLFGFTNSWVLNYKKRVMDPSSSVVVDTKLTKSIIRKKSLSFELFLEITNLFDESYSEQSGIRMPGRWLKSGARLEF